MNDNEIKSSCIFWTCRNKNILPLWCLIKEAKKQLSYGATWLDVSDCLEAANSRATYRQIDREKKRNAKK